MAMFKIKKTGNTKKKDDKEQIKIQGTKFAENLGKFATIKNKIDELTTELEMSKSYVKQIGIEEYGKLYSNKKSNPGSFIMVAEDGSSVLLAPTKKYIKIDEAGAETLKETYGEDIVTSTQKYAFNTKVLMRNMDTIQEILMNSDQISDFDKEALIEGTETYAIEKDALDKVHTLSIEAGVDLVEVIEDLNPIIMLKNPKAGTTK